MRATRPSFNIHGTVCGLGLQLVASGREPRVEWQRSSWHSKKEAEDSSSGLFEEAASWSKARGDKWLNSEFGNIVPDPDLDPQAGSEADRDERHAIPSVAAGKLSRKWRGRDWVPERTGWSCDGQLKKFCRHRRRGNPPLYLTPTPKKRSTHLFLP